MSSYDNMKTRLQYNGGIKQKERMSNHKLETLYRALNYSYQAETAVLPDGREFRCLINKDKLSGDYDEKIISIPFRDVCLNEDKVGKRTEGLQDVGLKCGDVFRWKENDTYWIVFLQYLEEGAYFRADIRLCEAETEINGKTYKMYCRGPAETTIRWNYKKGYAWNDLNYSLVCFITKNQETLDYLHRFSKLKVNGKTWKVAVVNEYFAEGIIKINLQEDYENEFVEVPTPKKVEEVNKASEDSSTANIVGKTFIRKYDTVTYSIENVTGGYWSMTHADALKIISTTEDKIKLEVISTKYSSFELFYEINGVKMCNLTISIKSV